MTRSSTDIEEVRRFQRWLPDHLMPSEFSHNYLFKRDEDGEYAIDFVRHYWEGWIASAIEHGAFDVAATAWKDVAQRAGVCMTCALGAPDTFGCTDRLNTGWDGGAPAGFVRATDAAQPSQDEMENYRLALAWIKGQSTDPQAKEIAATALDTPSIVLGTGSTEGSAAITEVAVATPSTEGK